MLLKSFTDYIKRNNLFSYGDTVIVAVSGGADSVCLLHLLCKLDWNLNIICAHVNHNLRETAKRDELFVKNLCETLGVTFKVYSADIKRIAKEENISEELAGRNERYKFLHALKEEYSASAILTAHTKNDQAETLLMHLIRGSGTHGLAGIAPKRDDFVARPLLQTSRDEIEAFLLENSFEWTEDETNATDDYFRNKVRHKLMPILCELNPSFIDAASRCAEIIRKEDDFLEEMVSLLPIIKYDGNTVLLDSSLLLENSALAGRIISKVLKNPSRQDIEAVFALADAPCGKKAELSGGLIARAERGFISITKNKISSYCSKLVFGKNYIPQTNIVITLSDTKTKGAVALPFNEYYARKKENGDRFSPEGMKGSKNLSDFFTDNKIPAYKRDEIPVIICNNKIASVGNLRRDKDFVPKKDEKIIYINIERNTEDAQGR